MTYDDAVRALGFEPDDSMEDHMPVLREAEEKLAEFASSSEDLIRRADYEHQLEMLREAIEVVEKGPEVKEETEPSKSEVSEKAPVKKASVVGEKPKVADDLDEKSESDRESVPRPPEEPKEKKSGAGRFVAALFFIAILAAAAWLFSPLFNQAKDAMHAKNVEELLAQGQAALEKRKWPEAEAKFQEVLATQPNQAEAKQGLLDSAEGREVARRQQVAYLAGTAQSSAESRDWDKVEEALNDLEKIEAEHELLIPTRKKMEEGRIYDQIAGLIEASEEAIQEERWDDLTTHAVALEEIAPSHVDLPRYRQLSEEGLRLMEERRLRAETLYQEALAMDEGVYSQEALELIREAMRLDRVPEYQALYDKLSGYRRVLNVPAEFPSITAALDAARPKDTIRLAEGIYEESLVFEHAVTLEGAGLEKTIITCPAEDASVVAVRPAVKEGRISGVTLRQSGFVLTPERFPVLVVEQGEITLESCSLEKGSGHGIAVLDGGVARLLDVRVSQCGWDGLAVHGEGSHAEVQSSRFQGNIHHGIDAWDGGTVTMRKSRASGNGLTGVLLMSAGKAFLIEQCNLDTNREVGIMVSKGAIVELISNQITSNLLGGVVVSEEGTKAKLRGNKITKNEKIGVMVDEKSTLEVYDLNVVEKNNGRQEDLAMKIVTRAEEESPAPLQVEPAATP